MQKSQKLTLGENKINSQSGMQEEKKLYSIDELENEFYGEKETPERDRYEFELSLELLSEKIKEIRKSKNLT